MSDYQLVDITVLKMGLEFSGDVYRIYVVNVELGFQSSEGSETVVVENFKATCKLDGTEAILSAQTLYLFIQVLSGSGLGFNSESSFKELLQKRIEEAIQTQIALRLKEEKEAK